MGKIYTIHDSLHGQIRLSLLEIKIISSDSFNRLHDVYQNSTAFLTFPSNRTKRFEHSLGTMKLVSDMFFHSILNADSKHLDLFLKIFQNEIFEIIKNSIDKYDSLSNYLFEPPKKDVYPEVPNDSFYIKLLPSNITKEYKSLYIILMQALRVVALLHDIGHPPFSHVGEKALGDVYKNFKDKPDLNSLQKEYIMALKDFFSENHQLHEEMGKKITIDILNNVLKDLKSSKPDEELTNDDMNNALFYYLVKECSLKIFNDAGNFAYLHLLVDGSLDADRLDYASRDPINSGMDCGKIEYDRIINNMKMFVSTKKSSSTNWVLFAVPIKALNSVEDFLKRRFLLYKNILYHHRIVKTDLLLEKCIYNLIIKYLNSNEKNNYSDIYSIPNNISGLWFPLKKGSNSTNMTALSQWNDAWLLTVLRKIYFKEFYRKVDSKNEFDYVLSKQLIELLQNKKNYITLLKRQNDFDILDLAIKEYFLKEYEKIEKIIIDLRNKYNNNNESDAVAIEGLLKEYENLNKTENISILRKIYTSSVLIEDKDYLGNIITKSIENSIKEDFKNIEFYDIIVVFKNIKVGLHSDKPITFYDGEELKTIQNISPIMNILSLETSYRPLFNIYILTENKEFINDNKEKLLQHAGITIAESLLKELVNELSQLKEEK